MREHKNQWATESVPETGFMVVAERYSGEEKTYGPFGSLYEAKAVTCFLAEEDPCHFIAKFCINGTAYDPRAFYSEQLNRALGFKSREGEHVLTISQPGLGQVMQYQHMKSVEAARQHALGFSEEADWPELIRFWVDGEPFDPLGMAGGEGIRKD